MRCKECNVDLSENYTKCPLCNAEASNEPPRLTGIKAEPYPHGVPVKPEKKISKPKYSLSLERIKAFFNL